MPQNGMSSGLMDTAWGRCRLAPQGGGLGSRGQPAGSLWRRGHPQEGREGGRVGLREKLGCKTVQWKPGKAPGSSGPGCLGLTGLPCEGSVASGESSAPCRWGKTPYSPKGSAPERLPGHRKEQLPDTAQKGYNVARWDVFVFCL